MNNLTPHQCHENDHLHASHESSLRSELLCHLPYAAFSIAFGFILLALLQFLGLSAVNPKMVKKGYHVLFHAFHYLHIIFATTGTFVTFSRFSRRVYASIALSVISPLFFCTLSDIAFPALSARLLGFYVPLHICFFDWCDALNIIPFLIMGILCGIALRQHHETYLGFFSLASHFVHILISSLAALFYIVSFGFDGWHHVMGLLFFFLVIAVLIPCTISDIVVPMYFARRTNKSGSDHAHPHH